MKREFRYSISDRKIRLTATARKAGEFAFERPAGLDLRRPTSDDSLQEKVAQK